MDVVMVTAAVAVVFFILNLGDVVFVVVNLVYVRPI